MNKELEKLNKELQTVFEERLVNNKIGIRIKTINDKLSSMYISIKEKKKKLSKERSDFEQLEKYTTNKLFKTILGDREKQLEKERQEYLQSALEYNSAIDEIELLKYEKNIIERKYKDESNLESHLQKIIKEKEKKLIDLNPKAATKINNFDLRISTQKLLIKEISGAIDVGTYCNTLLNETFANLNKVKNWGYISGRRNLSAHSKRSYIEKSRTLIANTKINLDKFSKEISDVYKDLNIKFRLENFDNFINVFFDNLITDWIIQSKIHNAINNIAAVKDKTNRILSNLKSDEKITLNSISKLEKEKELFILNLK